MEIVLGATACVRCTEVVRISECPLIEVLLYFDYPTTALPALTTLATVVPLTLLPFYRTSYFY